MTDKLDKARPQSWGVHVSVDGENVLTIETRMLSGIPDIEKHRDIVLRCADMLRSFIGSDEGESFDPDTATARNRELEGRNQELEQWVGEGFDALGYEETVWDGDDCAMPLPKVIARDFAALTRRAEAAEASLAALRERGDKAAEVLRENYGPGKLFVPTMEEGERVFRVVNEALALLTDPAQPTQDDDSPVPALLPCPFCGGENVQMCSRDARNDFFGHEAGAVIECRGCGAGMPGATDYLAAFAWNRRAPTPDMGKVEEALVAVCKAANLVAELPATVETVRLWEGKLKPALLQAEAALSQLRSPTDGEVEKKD